MLQTIDGVDVYVVNLVTMPELPITWSTPEEEPYARCLAHLIHEKIITEPGKYGIHVETIDGEIVYKSYRIIE